MEDLGEWKEVSNGEASRTYVFPSGEITIQDVSRVLVRPSGSHRLECKNGDKYIVSAGWLAISVSAKEWSF